MKGGSVFTLWFWILGMSLVLHFSFYCLFLSDRTNCLHVVCESYPLWIKLKYSDEYLSLKNVFHNDRTIQTLTSNRLPSIKVPSKPLQLALMYIIPQILMTATPQTLWQTLKTAGSQQERNCETVNFRDLQVTAAFHSVARLAGGFRALSNNPANEKQ